MDPLILQQSDNNEAADQTESNVGSQQIGERHQQDLSKRDEYDSEISEDNEIISRSYVDGLLGNMAGRKVDRESQSAKSIHKAHTKSSLIEDHNLREKSSDQHGDEVESAGVNELMMQSQAELEVDDRASDGC